MAIEGRDGKPVYRVRSPNSPGSFEFVSSPNQPSRVVPMPEFSAIDPAAPGRMVLVEIVEEDPATSPVSETQPQTPSQPETQPSTTETIMNTFASTLFFHSGINRASRAAAERLAVIEAAKAAAGINNETGEQVPDPVKENEAVAKAVAANKRNQRVKKAWNLFGTCLGFGTVFGAGAWAVKRQMAADAAEATVVVVETTTDTVVVASEGGSFVTTVLETLKASKTVAGVTLPVWGWGLSVVAVAATGYGIYRMVKKDNQEAKTKPVAAVDAGVTIQEAAREVRDGFVDGAVNTAVVMGSVLFAGKLGMAFMDKSTETFGKTYGPIFAIGAPIAAIGLTVKYGGELFEAIKRRRMSKSSQQAQTTQASQPVAA